MTGEAADATEPAWSVPYREFFLGGHLAEPTLAVVRSPAGFQHLWAEAHAGNGRRPEQPAVPPPPIVAWDRETVLVAALGQRPTITGYAVYISLYQNRYGLHVLVHEALPDPDEDQLSALGYPTVFAAAATDAVNVAFHVQQPVIGYEPTPEQRAIRQQSFDDCRQAQEKRKPPHPAAKTTTKAIPKPAKDNRPTPDPTTTLPPLPRPATPPEAASA